MKSPPELWAELSDPARLEHHLGELGEIRITSTQAEKLIEWEAEVAAGKVQIKPSGWGTQVLLSVTRELPVPEPLAEAEPTTTRASEPDREDQPETPLAPSYQTGPEQPDSPADEAPADEAPPDAWPEPLAQGAQPPGQTEPEPDAPAEPDPQPLAETHWENAQTLSRKGFFARLFRRASKHAPLEPPPAAPPASTQPVDPEPELEPAAHDDTVTVAGPEALCTDEPVALSEGDPAARQGPPPDGECERDEPLTLAELQGSERQEPAADAAADLAALEAQMVEQDSQMLTAMLDRLGAAHHRPFSRG